MKKKLLALPICSIALAATTACSPTNTALQADLNKLQEEKVELTNKLSESEEKIVTLTENIQQLEEEVKVHDEAMNQYFPIISDLSREFVQAHTSGDKEKIRQMLSDELSLENKENKLYLIVDDVE